MSDRFACLSTCIPQRDVHSVMCSLSRVSLPPCAALAIDGHDRSEAEWNLPVVRDAKGNVLERRRSCHICTQCVASWRGSFSTPLGCATCPMIWCSRCLTNIFGVSGKDEGFDIEAIIRATNATGKWSCFKCTGAALSVCLCRRLKCWPVSSHRLALRWPVDATQVAVHAKRRSCAG